ncbi:MAG: hypothetical protein IKD04_05060 [Clostridia bacterium]|nr:hypothetical protein [Clostridia bacterium]
MRKLLSVISVILALTMLLVSVPVSAEKTTATHSVALSAPTETPTYNEFDIDINLSGFKYATGIQLNINITGFEIRAITSDVFTTDENGYLTKNLNYSVSGNALKIMVASTSGWQELDSDTPVKAFTLKTKATADGEYTVSVDKAVIYGTASAPEEKVTDVAVTNADITVKTYYKDEFANDVWKDMLLNNYRFFDMPRNQASSDREYFDLLYKLESDHLQGACVDDDARYLYLSYEAAIAKMDLETEEIVGIITGFDDGVHTAGMDFYDGYLYCNATVPASKTYVMQIDASKFHGLMDTPEEWETVLRVMLPYETMQNARDLMGDYDINGDGYAETDELVERSQGAEGHRYACCGVGAMSFGTLPGEFGEKDADTYMILVSGARWYGDPALNKYGEHYYRYDDEHCILYFYNVNDFLSPEASSKLLKLEFRDDDTGDTNGVANARSFNFEEDAVIKAEKTLFAFTGNCYYGPQSIDYNPENGDIWLYGYVSTDGAPVLDEKSIPHSPLYVIDGSREPQFIELQLGQNVDLTNTDNLYGTIKNRSVEIRAEVTAWAKERAERYRVGYEGSWLARPDDSMFNDDGYLMGYVPYLKCLCGEDCQEADYPYIGYENVLLCSRCQPSPYGAQYLGNGYWLFSKAEQISLNHYEGKYLNITPIQSWNYETHLKKQGLYNDPSVEAQLSVLQSKIALAEDDFPTQDEFTDATWENYQNALKAAKAMTAENTLDEIKTAQAALKQAQKDLRQVDTAYDNAIASANNLNTVIYTNQSVAILQTALDAFGENPSQLKIAVETQALVDALDALEIIGDIKADNEVNILDMVRLKKCLAEETEMNGYAYDTNLNEVLDTGDLVQLQKFLLGTISTFK